MAMSDLRFGGHGSCRATLARIGLLAVAAILTFGCSSGETEGSSPPAAADVPTEPTTALAPIRVSGSYWIELSPVLVAANTFYPAQMPVGQGGIVRITAGEADLATNAETQLLRETVDNPDLRIIMTVTESFYRLVARRSAGIETLADLQGKRVMLPANTSANYYLVAMLRTVGTDGRRRGDRAVCCRSSDGQTGMDQMSDALKRGDVDAISMWEPEPADAIIAAGRRCDRASRPQRLPRGLQFARSRSGPRRPRPSAARSSTFVRAVARATDALKADPEAYWPHVSSITGFYARKSRPAGPRWSSRSRSFPTCWTCSRWKKFGLPRNATARRVAATSWPCSSIARSSRKRSPPSERLKRASPLSRVAPEHAVADHA